MSRRHVDKTGQTFGALTVMEDLPGQGTRPRVKVRCRCGREKLLFKARLHSQPKSCGRGCANPLPRKKIGTTYDHDAIRQLAAEGFSQRAIAEKMGCGVARVADVTGGLTEEQKRSKVDNRISYLLSSGKGTAVLRVVAELQNTEDTHNAIAARCGISRERVRQIEAAAIQSGIRLRKRVG